MVDRNGITVPQEGQGSGGCPVSRETGSPGDGCVHDFLTSRKVGSRTEVRHLTSRWQSENVTTRPPSLPWKVCHRPNVRFQGYQDGRGLDGSSTRVSRESQWSDCCLTPVPPHSNESVIGRVNDILDVEIAVSKREYDKEVLGKSVVVRVSVREHNHWIPLTGRWLVGWVIPWSLGKPGMWQVYDLLVPVNITFSSVSGTFIHPYQPKTGVHV